MKIYTKTGDAGDTGLFGGGRVAKDHPRVEAYGDVDELNAVLGLARAIELMPRIDEVLVPVQRDLFAIGALLATPDREKMREQLAEGAHRRASASRSSSGRSTTRERELEPLRASSSPAARRRPPRCTWRAPSAAAPSGASSRLQHEVELPALAVIYLNRLSDLLFTLARVANKRAGAGEVTW